MKPITKIIIFLVIAFIIVIIITAVKGSKVVAPVTTTTPSSTVSASPTAATYTLADVAKHKTATDCWTTVGGNVFDVSAFVNKHPGGVAAISQICGIDGTAAFTQMHGSNAKAQAMLASLKIGVLATN